LLLALPGKACKDYMAVPSGSLAEILRRPSLNEENERMCRQGRAEREEKLRRQQEIGTSF